MKNTKLVFIFLFTFASLYIFSCSENNPIGPVIKQTWGDYDYFGYYLHTNWDYQENYPNTNSMYQIRYNIFGQEFRNPYTGWQKLLIIDGEPIGYYLIHVDRNGLYYYNFTHTRWDLFFELPLIIGNKWDLNYSYDYDPQTVAYVNITREVLDREDQSVMGIKYKDCTRVRETSTVQYIRSNYLDSSYYFIKEEWFAPNTGTVKWLVTSTDVEDWEQASCYLERKYGERYIWSYGQMQSSQKELLPFPKEFSEYFKKFLPQH